MGRGVLFLGLSLRVPPGAIWIRAQSLARLQQSGFVFAVSFGCEEGRRNPRIVFHDDSLLWAIRHACIHSLAGLLSFHLRLSGKKGGGGRGKKGEEKRRKKEKKERRETKELKEKMWEEKKGRGTKGERRGRSCKTVLLVVRKGMEKAK